MCGLNVLFARDETIVTQMNRAMAHRGVRSRVQVVGGVTLGHVRLPIQDTSEESDQPMLVKKVTGNHEAWVIYVGEMFNFREFDLNAVTDLPALYKLIVLGLDGYADGFWAMAWTTDGKTVSVTTDSLGKKQLYLRMDEPRAISSELGPLVGLGAVTPDELYYSNVLKWGYDPDLRRTPFKEIRRLSPGKIYHLSSGGEVLRAGEPRKITPNRGDLYRMLQRSVKNRTMSDVPISLLLSGGLDSTIIFELLKKTGVPFTAYHVDNGEDRFLEYLDFPARVVLKKLPLRDATVKEALQANEVPVDLGSMLPQRALAEAVREDGCVVALSGDGADELFGGYGRAKRYDSQHSDVFIELPCYHLPRLDRVMMRSTVELRCPFLSVPVIRHALSLPWGDRTEKEELKRVFEGLLPLEITQRKKEPLKIRAIREDALAWRKALVELHRNLYFKE